MIDYGMGQTNIDKETGIRYGVISQNEVLQAWCDSSEAYYGDPHCPKCGNEAVVIPSHTESDPSGEGKWVSVIQDVPEHMKDYEENKYCGCCDFACDACKYLFGSDEAYGDEPLSHTLDDGEYKAECGESGDIFITKSPYYTYGPFCSPCAPGAVYLASASKYDEETGIKAYCFCHDFFEDNKAPYKVYSVATGEEIK